MRKLEYRLEPQARCLMVLFPGAGDSAETFEQRGIIDTIRAANLSVDVVAANATVPYYAEGTLWPRVKIDVIDPVRARNYDRVWFVGISLGGMGSAFTALKETSPIDGVLLLGPYLGPAHLIESISKAGGLSQWEPGPLPAPDNEAAAQKHVWSWLKESAAQGHPSIYVGYGKADRLERTARTLAAALPEEQVYRMEGGHNWAVWMKLWTAFLAKSKFATECSFQSEKPLLPGL